MSSLDAHSAPGQDSLIGARVPRVNARRFVAGRGRYTDDVRVPGLLHAAFLRSSFAHARIVAIDLAAARAMPGVVAVYSGKELLEVCQPWSTRLATLPHRSAAQPPLAVDRALWQGQPVAIVVATTRALAEDATAVVEIEWEELPAQADAEASLAADATAIHPELGSNLAFAHKINAGDADAVFAKAAHVLRRKLKFARHTGVPLESRAVIAEFDPGVRQLTVHQSTQVPHQLRANYAEIFGLAEVDIRVITPDVGGGFGLKLHVYDDEMAAVAAAILLGRPVKYVCDRFEAFSSDVHARSHEVEAAIAVDAEGNILGFSADDLAEIGPYSVYPRTSVLEGMQAVGMVGAPYANPALRASLRVVYQNKALVGAYRGVGQPVACAVTEQMVDAAAAAIGMDPAEMRRRNYRRAAVHGSASAGGLELGELSHDACLDALLKLMDYPRLREEQKRAREQGRYLGIGLAAFVELTAPGAAFYGANQVQVSAQDGCFLRLEPSGEITCVTSTTDQGQGADTGLQQLVADAMGLPMRAVRVVRGDTLATPLGGGAWASRGLTVGGEAALAASLQLRERLQAVAAAILEVPAAELVLANAAFSGGGKTLTLKDLAQRLHYRQKELPAGVSMESASVAHAVPMKPFQAANGIQGSLVELDPDSGFIRILGHWIVEDCGRVINPLLADEQLRGGVVQGLGGAFFEECRYDEYGQLLSGTMADYLVPMAGEMPDIKIGHVFTPVEGTLLGAKGVGEAGVIGAGAAAANAVNDALAPFGCVLTEQPYTPERVLRALGKVA